MARSKELLPPSASDCAWFKINETFWHPTPRVSVAVTSLVRHPVTKLREAIRATTYAYLTNSSGMGSPAYFGLLVLVVSGNLIFV
jgi:hypothetical protein